MTIVRRGRRGPVARPQRWQRILTAVVVLGSAAGGIASNTLANEISSGDFHPLTWAAAGLATIAAAAFAGLQVQDRRAREAERAAEPPPLVRHEPLVNLPYTAGFVGRRSAVDWMVDAIRAERALALVGRRAVGTSACVIEAANMVRARYPDGQLYLDLRAAGRGLRPHEIVTALCRQLRVDEAALGAARDLDALVSLLWSHVGERRMLIVADNVSATDQVRPLLPPAPHCRLLMAGSGPLDGLDGVHVRRLAEPAGEEAVELFVTAARDAGPVRRDLRADPAVREMVELAGRQPHAVRELGYWLGRNGWSAPELLATLRRATTPPGRPDATLTLLADADRAYLTLSRGARRLYRLLALVRQPLSRDAIAALGGVNRGRADRMLAELVSGAFVTGTADGRYRLRPLLVGYAHVHLCRTDPPRRQVAALARVVRYLARQAERHAADLSGPGPAAPPGTGPGVHWFTRHEALLRTVVCGAWGAPDTRGTWGAPGVGSALGVSGALPARPSARVRRWWLRLAVALCTWYAIHARLDDWAAVCRAVLDSPVARERPAVAGWAHNELGAVYRWQGDPHRAAVELTTAVALRHRRGAAQSRTNLGLALLDVDDVDGALDQLQRARRQRSPSDRAGQALTELGLGAAFLARREPRQARHHLILAANRFDAIGDRRGYAAALTNLVLAEWWLGERLDAAHAWHVALDTYAALDSHEATADRYGRAVALLNAGAAVVSGRPSRAGHARDLLLESLRLREETGQPTGRALLYLGDAAGARGEADEAQRYWKEAAEACRAAGDEAGVAAARQRMAT